MRPAGRILLEQGMDGLKQLLETVGAPPLTFDQETQIRNLHDLLRREAARLQEERQTTGSSFNAMLADQLFLAALKFLNTVQRSAMGDLTSTVSRQGGDGGGNDDDGLVIDGFSGGRIPNRDEIMEIRINDNAFTAELSEQGRGRTEVRTRGGTGAFNGDSTFNFRDESLDASVNVRSRDLTNPYSWNSEATLETRLPFGLALTGSYGFVRRVHLFRGRNLNAPMDITSLAPRSCRPQQTELECVRPQPERGNIVQLESTGLSSTHEFRVGFQQRMSFINVRGNYSARSAYSDVSDEVLDLPADNYDMSPEWGRIAPGHDINASVNVRMPWNVAADMEINWNSGEPYSIITGRDDNKDTNTTDRPVGVQRNSVTGPSFFEMNLNFSKTFTLVPESSAGSQGPVAGGGYFGRRSGIRMTISAEALNVLNKVNYDRISGVLTSPFFGQPIRARDGRQISLSALF